MTFPSSCCDFSSSYLQHDLALLTYDPFLDLFSVLSKRINAEIMKYFEEHSIDLAYVEKAKVFCGRKICGFLLNVIFPQNIISTLRDRDGKKRSYRHICEVVVQQMILFLIDEKNRNLFQYLCLYFFS